MDGISYICFCDLSNFLLLSVGDFFWLASFGVAPRVFFFLFGTLRVFSKGGPVPIVSF